VSKIFLPKVIKIC